MKITGEEKLKSNPIADNFLGLCCFAVFAGGIFHVNSRAIPEPIRPSLVETTSQELQPNMALLRQGDMLSQDTIRQFKVVLR